MMTCTAESLLQELDAQLEDLKVVSYKWLARQYQIPSNFAKQVLYRFAQEHGDDVKVIYLISGYLKEDSAKHIVRLVDGSSLADCQANFSSITGLHVHSVMPAERNPTTDAGRLCAEDTEQSRHFYQSIVKQNALVDGSADVFAKNAISSVKFDVDIHFEDIKQQQQKQQGAAAAANGARSPAVAAASSPTEPAAADDAPSAKRHKPAADGSAAAATAAAGPSKMDVDTGEEIWIEDDEPQQQRQQQMDIEAAPAAGNAQSGGGLAVAAAGASGVSKQQGRSGGAASSRAAVGKGGSGRGGRSGAKGGGSGKAQTNIMNFFGKK